VAASVGKSRRPLLIYGGALLLAVIVGASVAYAPRFAGDSGPYIMVGVFLAAIVAMAILWEWRFGVLMVLGTLPYLSMINLGTLTSATKVLSLLTFFSLALALLRDQQLFERFLRLWQQPLTLAVFAFVLWVMVSILWASYQGEALVRASSFVGVFAMMMTISMLEGRYLTLSWVVTALSMGLSIPAAYVLPQSGKMAEQGRFGVGGADPNSWACAAVIVFLVTYFGLGRHKVFVYVLAPLLFYGIFASQSRTALLALAVTPLLGFLFVPRLATWLGGRALLMYGLGAAVLVGVTLIIPTVGESALERYQTLSQYQEEDTWSGRWSIWQGAFKVIASHPIVGVGAGNFAEAAVKYSAFIFENAAEEGETGGVAHNMFLSVASELGFVGLALFLLVLFLAFKVAISASRRFVLGAGLFLGLVAYVIAGMSLTWESHKLGYILLGSILALKLQWSMLPVPEGERKDRS